MIRVDLYSARTIDRPGLLSCMLNENEGVYNLSSTPQDLAEFQRILTSYSVPSRIAITHFDHVQNREYGVDFFTTLRYLVTEERKLILLLQSRAPFNTLLRAEECNILSQLAINTIELRGRK